MKPYKKPYRAVLLLTVLCIVFPFLFRSHGNSQLFLATEPERYVNNCLLHEDCSLQPFRSQSAKALFAFPVMAAFMPRIASIYIDGFINTAFHFFSPSHNR